MATAQKAMGSMQRLKEDFATVRSVAGLFRLRAAGDPQRVARCARRGVAGNRSPGPSWPAWARKRPGGSSLSA